MSRPLIAVDIDDTLADSTELLRLHVNRRYEVAIPKEAYKTEGEYWGYYERVWAEHGLTGLDHKDFEASLADEIAGTPLLPSALFAGKQLYEDFDIVIVTARAREREALTRQWIHTTFEGMAIDVHFSEAHKDESKMTKGQICKSLGASYLIDDNVGHCESALSEGVTPLLFGEYGWQGTVPEGIVKCKDWPNVLDYFNSQ